jgi:flavin-dependent dehydrogenase
MKIVIVGGGPAGSLCAIRLLQEAESAGKQLRVIVYESKPFQRGGPAGCNFCAGVITARTVEKLHNLGIELAPGVIQRRIDSFYYITEGGETEFSRENQGTIFSVFRGGGPRHLDHGPEDSFDGHLLLRAEELGSEIRHERVRNIERSSDGIIKISTDGGEEEADLVVGAFGINSGFGERLWESIGYRPPKSISAAQAEFEMDEAEIERIFGNRIVAFALRFPGIRFLAVTPKRRYLTVTAVGHNAGLDQLLEYMRHPRVARFFPGIDLEADGHCNCHPRMPLGFARGAVSERFLAVGDAFASRFYKNGLGSALFSADAAARMIVHEGYGRSALKAYRAAIFSRFRVSNRCGRVLFVINDITHKSRILSGATLAYLEREKLNKIEKKRHFNNLMWSLFAGDRSYCRVMGDALRPGLVFNMLLWHIRSIILGVGRWLFRVR